MHLIPQSWSHFHILVSVCPSVGLIFALGFYVTAMLTNNAAMAGTFLAAFRILGILAIPVYFSGDGWMAALSRDPKISQDLMDTRFGWGLAELAVLVMMGCCGWFGLL